MTRKNFQVSAVASVPEALDLISKQSFDVLLTDLNVGQPGDGFTLVSAMRRVQPDVCTFILTGYPDLDSAINAIRSQVDNYFLKPLDVDRLLAAISSATGCQRTTHKQPQRISVAELIHQGKQSICERWLMEVMNDPDLAAVPVSESERLDHVPGMLDELLGRAKENDQLLTPTAADAARAHGRTRYRLGYTIPQMILEARLLQKVLSATIQQELLRLELSTLVNDIFQIGQSLQAALEISIRSYQAHIPESLQMSFSGLYRSSHLGVAIADEEQIVDANDTLLQMVGYTREQLVAGEIDWVEMTSEKFRTLDQKGVEQLREFGTCVPFETEFVLPDGSKLPFLIGAVRLSAEPLQWCAYMVDLTQQRRLQAAEQQVQAWESRNALINRLAHEINNPLAALMFTLHLLRTEPDLSNDAQGLIRNAEEMLSRINDSVQVVLVESRS